MSEERKSFQIIKAGNKYHIKRVVPRKRLFWTWTEETFVDVEFDELEDAREHVKHLIALREPGRMVAEIYYD